MALCVSAADRKYQAVPNDPMHARIYTLPNGLKVYLSQNAEKPRVTAHIAVNTGHRNDPADCTGLAHYLEHLMFKGTESFGTTDYAAEKPYLDQITNLYEEYRKLTDPAERKAKSDEIWNNIEEGKHYTGIVRSLPDFGAFVDIGGVDGLVHITELSWKRISKPSDVLSVGEEVEVYVKSFDRETKKSSLGYRKPEDDPFYNIEERIPVGSCVKGTVVRLTDFGAFVQLEPELDALCHVSEISSVRLQQPSDVLSVGMEVEVKVIDVKKDARRISISIKEVAPIDPAETDDEEVYSIEETEA